jgi:penicillin-binding protein 1C
MKKVWLIIFPLALLSFIGLNLLFPLPDKIEYSTMITDSKGEVIHAFLTSDEKWRMKTSLAEISPLLKNTIIEKEDKFFYHHAGVNPLAIARAFTKNILHARRTSGASTITMQVARALEPKSRNYFNKIREIFRAWQLEWKYSKEDILQMYCNLLPYGSNIEGMKSASLLYFKKNPDHLSLAEITALCVIPNRPSSLVPGKNNDAIIKERNKWLQTFADEHVFTQKQIEDALTEPFDVMRGTVPKYIPHLSIALKKTGGPEIHSTIILNTQLQVEKIVADYSRMLRLKNIKNAAVVIVDNSTHKVISYIGSSDFYDTTDAGQVDGAVAVREPGSTLKPLLYGMCIDQGLLTPKAVITDVNVNYGGYAPENFNKQFNGYVTMEYALEHSLNIPAVKSLNMLGKDKFVSTLGACNFRQIRKDQKKLGLSLILGGCGASLLELTGMYSALANGGAYTQPSFTAEKSSGHVFQVISPAAAYMINETLSKISRPDFPINWQATEHMPKIAWKTGTSYGRRDAWSIGYNKKYTVGVWTGNFSGSGVPDLSGAEIATPLLFRIFNTIDYDSDEEWFIQPEDCANRMVCSETGMSPSAYCTNIVGDHFIPLVSSSRQCNNIEEIPVSADEKISYCKTCMPLAGYKKKLFKIVPPEMQAYYDEHRIAYQKVPPHNPDCQRIFRDGQPLILSPKSGAEYLLSKKNPEPLQLKCRAGNDVNKIYWYVNNHYYQTGTAGAAVFFVPSEGPVKISCTDDKGRNKDIWINVRFVDL